MAHHATKSPSSFPAKKQCIHYVSGGSAAADRGTLLHEIFEGDLKLDPLNGERITKALDEGKISVDDLDGISWAQNELFELFCKYTPIEEREGIENLSQAVAAGVANCERKVSVMGEDFEELSFGTLDFDTVRILCDLKTGEIRNYREQMDFYALAKFQEDHTLEKVIVIELYSKKKRSIIYEINRDDAEKSVFGIAKRIDEGTEDPKSCDYCKWCTKRESCPALIDAASQLQENRDEFPKDFSFRASEVREAALGALAGFRLDPDDPANIEALKKNGANLAFLWEMGEAANAFFEGVKATIKTVVKEGVEVPGLKLQEKAGRAKVTDANGVFEIVSDFITTGEFLEATTVSTAQISKKVDNAASVAAMFNEAKIEIPLEFKNKKGDALLKTKSKKAFDYLLEKKGLLEKGAPSISVVKDNSTSYRKGDTKPKEIESEEVKS